MSVDVGYTPDDDGRSYATGRVDLNGIQMMLIRMESKFDALRQDVHYMKESHMVRNAEVERRFMDHESRLRAMESKRYLEPRSVTAVFAVILPVIAIAVSIIAILAK